MGVVIFGWKLVLLDKGDSSCRNKDAVSWTLGPRNCLVEFETLAHISDVGVVTNMNEMCLNQPLILIE